MVMQKYNTTALTLSLSTHRNACMPHGNADIRLYHIHSFFKCTQIKAKQERTPTSWNYPWYKSQIKTRGFFLSWAVIRWCAAVTVRKAPASILHLHWGDATLINTCENGEDCFFVFVFNWENEREKKKDGGSGGWRQGRGWGETK